MRYFLTIVVVSLSMAGSPAFAAWSTFKDPGQNFTFDAPTEISVTHGQGVSQSGKVIPEITYGCDESLVAMAVIDGQIAAQPLIGKAFTPSQTLDQFVAIMQQGAGTKASSVRKEILDGQEGRRMEITGPNGVIYTYRFFVFRDHLYTVFSGYSPNASDKLKADAIRFHKSFHLSLVK
jgi:hypothetical protein